MSHDKFICVLISVISSNTEEFSCCLDYRLHWEALQKMWRYVPLACFLLGHSVLVAHSFISVHSSSMQLPLKVPVMTVNWASTLCLSLEGIKIIMQIWSLLLPFCGAIWFLIISLYHTYSIISGPPLISLFIFWIGFLCPART